MNGRECGSATLPPTMPPSEAPTGKKFSGNVCRKRKHIIFKQWQRKGSDRKLVVVLISPAMETSESMWRKLLPCIIVAEGQENRLPGLLSTFTQLSSDYNLWTNVRDAQAQTKVTTLFSFNIGSDDSHVIRPGWGLWSWLKPMFFWIFASILNGWTFATRKVGGHELLQTSEAKTIL